VNSQDFLVAVQKMRSGTEKRKFRQAVDLAINFKDMDFSKPDNRIEMSVKLPHAYKAGTSKAVVFVRDKGFASALSGKAKVILENEIPALDKKAVELLLNEYDVFLAEGPVMLSVGKYLGQQLAPKGKMPKPVTADVKSFDALLTSASGSAKLGNKKGKNMPVVHSAIGNEEMPDEKLAENAFAVYSAVLAELPSGEQNIKSIYMKFTMGPAIKIGEKANKE